MVKTVTIPCDDGSGNKLRLTQSEDGDIWVSIIDKDGHGLRKSVRICTTQGSGNSRKMGIRKALQDVIQEAELSGFGEGGE